MIQLGRLRPQVGFDVAQAFTPRQLRERKATKLVEAGEMFDLVIAIIAGNTTTERRQRQVIHKLRENVLTQIGHSGTPLKIWGNP